jgi:hypothetical protein
MACFALSFLCVHASLPSGWEINLGLDRLAPAYSVGMVLLEAAMVLLRGIRVP